MRQNKTRPFHQMKRMKKRMKNMKKVKALWEKRLNKKIKRLKGLKLQYKWVVSICILNRVVITCYRIMKATKSKLLIELRSKMINLI